MVMFKHVTCLGLVVCAAMLVSGSAAVGQTTERVSVASDGTQGNAQSGCIGYGGLGASFSADGRFVVFDSSASNLVPNDKNKAADVFVHDRKTGETTRVSVCADGREGDSMSFNPSISADGRFVAFISAARNFVPVDRSVGWPYRVYVHDRQTGQNTLVSVTAEGADLNVIRVRPSISDDGRFVAFRAGGYFFVSDLTERTLTCVSGDPDGGGQYGPAISGNGRFVAFCSASANLVEGDNNQCNDMFVYDRDTGQTTRVSVASDGTQANGASDWCPSISADGRYVTFQSDATNLVPGDDNGLTDIFVHDRQTGETTRASVGTNGEQGNGGAATPNISADGRWLTFNSSSTNLVPGDTNGFTDVFVRDLQTGETTRVNVSNDGSEANDKALRPSISGDGRCVGFVSEASNLVFGDTNAVDDVFVHDRLGVPAPPEVGVTVVSVVAVDIRQGGKYNITANVKNETAGPLTLTVHCTVEDAQGHVQVLAPRPVSLASGSTAPVKFNDTSSLPKGTYTATVTVDGYPDVGDSNWDTFLIK
jgi:Tol biopolymer transport system component